MPQTSITECIVLALKQTFYVLRIYRYLKVMFFNERALMAVKKIFNMAACLKI